MQSIEDIITLNDFLIAIVYLFFILTLSYFIQGAYQNKIPDEKIRIDTRGVWNKE